MLWRVSSYTNYSTYPLYYISILHMCMHPYSKLDTDECLANSTSDGCEQVCTNTIGSFQCSCIEGYTLSSNDKSCLDIDECTAGTHNCQQLCINTNGGYFCGCNSGYQLNSDGRNCSGMYVYANDYCLESMPCQYRYYINCAILIQYIMVS